MEARVSDFNLSLRRTPLGVMRAVCRPFWSRDRPLVLVADVERAKRMALIELRARLLGAAEAAEVALREMGDG